VAPPGELRIKAGVVLLAGKSVSSTPERLRGEVLTTRRYTNSPPLPFYLYHPLIIIVTVLLLLLLVGINAATVMQTKMVYISSKVLCQFT